MLNGLVYLYIYMPVIRYIRRIADILPMCHCNVVLLYTGAYIIYKRGTRLVPGVY